MLRRKVIAVLCLFLIQASVVFFNIFSMKSEEANAVILGLSFSRLVLFVVIMVVFLLVGAALVVVLRWRSRIEKNFGLISEWLAIKSYRHFSSFLATVGFFVLFGALLAGGGVPRFVNVPDYFSLLFARLQASLVFAALVCLELIWLIRQFYKARNLENSTEKIGRYNFWQLLALTILGICLMSMVVFFIYEWVLLLTRAPLSKLAPFFFWQNLENIVPFNIFHLLILTGISLLGTVWILRYPKRPMLKVAMFGSALILILAAFRPDSISPITWRMNHAGTYSYTQLVCASDHYTEIIQGFNSLSASSTWLQTKPPGYLWPYWAAKEVLTLLTPAEMMSVSNCQTSLAGFLTTITPFFSMLVLLPICQVSKKVLNPGSAVISGLVYVFMPNTLLMAGYFDQFFLPLVFTLALLLVILSLEKQSFWWAVLTGGFIYLCIFTSFSLLPGGVMAFLWLGLDALKNRNSEIKGAIRVGGGFLAGGLLMGWLFLILFSYNPVARLFTSLESHRKQIMIQDKIRNIIENIHINITEYMVWIGPTLIILIILGLIWKITRHDPAFSSQKSVFLFGTGLLFLALLVSGQNRAEVGRLWLFFNPVVAISTISLLEVIPKKRITAAVLIMTVIQIWFAFFYSYALLGEHTG